MKIKPIDDLVLSGFSQRFQQQFDCPCYYVTAADKTKAAQKINDGKPLSYPYAFLEIQSWTHSPDSYASNQLARQGLVTLVDDDGNAARRVRIIPCNFDLQVTYVTNDFKSAESSVRSFVRRWLFSRRNGSLQFTINYGLLSFQIQVTQSDSVPFTARENATESETAYQIVTTATIKGFVSEPELGEIGLVGQIALEDVLSANGLSGAQFFPFPT